MNNMKKEQLRLYAVTDRTWLGNETLYEQVEKALEGGATLVQLREKDFRKRMCRRRQKNCWNFAIVTG